MRCRALVVAAAVGRHNQAGEGGEEGLRSGVLCPWGVGVDGRNEGAGDGKIEEAATVLEDALLLTPGEDRAVAAEGEAAVWDREVFPHCRWGGALPMAMGR